MSQVKKLIIVGTAPSIGKGGISTALTGYLEGLDTLDVDFEYIESHHGGKSTFLTWLSAFAQVLKLAAKYRRNAIFWFHCGPWLSMIRKASLAIVARLFGATTLGHIHSPAFNSYLSNNILTRTFAKICVLPYSKLVVLTPWWQELLASFNITKKSLISPNPNNAQSCMVAKEFESTPREVNNTEKINVLTMARMVKGKGVEVVLEAMANLPENYCLTVAGDGDQLSNFKALAQELRISERVQFSGWVDGEKKEQLLRQADMFCLPSTYDSFGMVFIEAMAYDLPVIAYGWGPINDVVSPDVGECCSEVSANMVAEKLRHVAEHLSSYSGAGPKRVLSLYTPEAVANNIIKKLALND